MNVIDIVFPECYHLLCHSHIQKNVHAKCKTLVNSIDTWDVVLQYMWVHVKKVDIQIISLLMQS